MTETRAKDVPPPGYQPPVQYDGHPYGVIIPPPDKDEDDTSE